MEAEATRVLDTLNPTAPRPMTTYEAMIVRNRPDGETPGRGTRGWRG